MKSKPKHTPKKPAQGRKSSQKPQTKKPDKPRLKIHLFGMHAVREAWQNPKRHIHTLYITGSALKQFEPVLKTAQHLKRPDPVIIDKAALDKTLPPGTVHQGIALNCQPLDEKTVQDLIILADQKPVSLFVILDQVTDPHNIGAVLRSACAFGADGLILQSKHSPALDGILAKTACGALEHIPVALETNLSRAIETLRNAGYFIYGLDEQGPDNLNEMKNNPNRIAIVLGAEGPGIRPLVKKHCDQLLHLPATGPVSSLNVSNAAAVSLYQFCKKP